MKITKITGIKGINFNAKDGTFVNGKKLYLSEAISPERGSGCETESFYMSKARIDALSFVPKVGDIVEPLYNRYGKLVDLRLNKESIDTDLNSGFDEDFN